MSIFKIRKYLFCTSSYPKTIYDVCIVGGGSVGMITALMLAKHQYRIVVLEKDNSISSKIM